MAKRMAVVAADEAIPEVKFFLYRPREGRPYLGYAVSVDFGPLEKALRKGLGFGVSTRGVHLSFLDEREGEVLSRGAPDEWWDVARVVGHWIVALHYHYREHFARLPSHATFTEAEIEEMVAAFRKRRAGEVFSFQTAHA